jgi:hypothetical protein
MLCRQITGKVFNHTFAHRINPLIILFLYSNPNIAPNMAAYAAGIPVDIASKHRQGHPLKSFAIPAPPSNTPLIPNHKPGS